MSKIRLSSEEVEDAGNGKKYVVRIGVDRVSAFMGAEELGVADMDKGYPVLLELYQGEYRLYVWGDINDEEPTHVISLEGARETKRKT